MDIDFRGAGRQSEEAIRRFIGSQNTLHDVVVASLARRPPLLVADVVVQDEYTHDVILPWDDCTWLVYDTTWLGGLTAVAVWDHRPSADELLAARLASGWVPTPTATRDGDVILGHAACRVR